MIDVVFSNRHRSLTITRDKNVVFLFRGIESRLAFVLLEFDRDKKEAIRKEEDNLSKAQIETAYSISVVAKSIVTNN